MLRKVLMTCLAIFAISALSACGHRHESSRSETNVQGASYILNADDFDLETVMTLLRENKVKDAKDLQDQINGDTGLANADVDKDGNRDFILVKEENASDGQKTLAFYAVPSGTGKEEDAVSVAEIKFSRTANATDVTVEGGYSHYVNGYADNYYSYHHGMSVGDAMFMMWLWSPRPIYYSPYSMYAPMWTPRPLYSRSTIIANRSTYRATHQVTSVAPMARQGIPSHYKMDSATRTPSRFTQGRGDPTGTALGARRDSVSDFKARAATAPKATGGFFGNSRPSAPAQAASPSRSYTPAPSTSRPSYTPSRSSSGGGGGGRRR